MRRADRLFQIVQAMRGRRLVTARQLASRLQVSERTVYRDVRDLTLSGVPIEGEAGVGYVLRRGFDMPPLMFTREEIEALVVGARMVKAWGGTKLGSAATSALEKVEGALPDELRRETRRSRLFALDFHMRPALAATLDLVRRAINERRVIEFDYVRADGAQSHRAAQPLGLFFWGPVWTLAAWCEMRGGFRNFRPDRMNHAALTARNFADEPGRTFADYLRTVECDSPDNA